MVADVLLTALGHAWRTLDAAGMKMAVMGGIALASWKYVRATRDVDLLVGLDGRSEEELLAQLRAASILPRRQPATTSLGDGVNEAWREAFPTESLPDGGGMSSD